MRVIKYLLFICTFLISSISYTFWSDKQTDTTNIKALNSQPNVQIITYEIAICLIDDESDESDENVAYYHLPTTKTILKCEVNNQIITGNMNAFYKEGWRLAHIANIDSRLQTSDGKVPSSIIYLEKRLLAK